MRSTPPTPWSGAYLLQGFTVFFCFFFITNKCNVLNEKRFKMLTPLDCARILFLFDLDATIETFKQYYYECVYTVLLQFAGDVQPFAGTFEISRL